MDEIWERAVETALDGQTDVGSVRTLTLDGVVKCVHGRLPPPSLFEKFRNLQHLSIANIGVSSLEQFPRLQNLEKLILSDNRIAGGLEFLVAAGLNSLRDLDLSNNRIQDINDLRPLAELRLVSLDLYECPVTRVKDYRSRVFGLIKSLKYLDKMDAEENERPESDEEEDEEEDEDDPGSGEIDGEERPNGMNNGHRAVNDGIVDVDEDEESDADEEETEMSRGANGMARGVLHHQSNGFRIEGVDGEEYDDEYGDGDGEGEDDEENDSVDEIDEEGDDDEDVVEVHEIEDSDDEEDGVEDDEDEDDDDEEDVDEEEVDNDDGNFGGQENTGRLAGTEGEIDGHEQGEDDEDDNGETGEEEQGVEEEGDYQVDEEAEDEEEDCDSGYLVQPVAQAEGINPGLGEMPQRHDSEDADLAEYIEEDDDEDGEVQELPPSSSQKRKRDGGENDSDDGGIGDEDEEDDDIVECTRSSKSSKHQK